MTLLPKTKAGKWAGYLFGLMVIFFIAANLFMNFTDTLDSERTGLNWPVIPAFIIGILSLIISVYAIVKEKERSLTNILIPVIMIVLLIFGSIDT